MDAQGQVGRLGAGVGESDAFVDGTRRRIHPPLQLELVPGAEVCAARELRHDRLDDRRMVVAEQQRAVTPDVVDVLVSVDVHLRDPAARVTNGG